MRHIVCCLFGAVCLLAPVQALAQNGVVELPQQFIDTTYPAEGPIRSVCPSGCNHTTLQAAIDNANPGDTITLVPGSVHTSTSTITLKAKTNPNNLWIVIRSASTAFNAGGSLAPGTRVAPGNASSMAVIESPGGNGAAIATATGASRYRLVGLEVRPRTSETNLTNLISLGSATATSTAASYITIDRCYVHGRASGSWGGLQWRLHGGDRLLLQRLPLLRRLAGDRLVERSGAVQDRQQLPRSSVRERDVRRQ